MSKQSRDKFKESTEVENNLIQVGLLSDNSGKHPNSHKPLGVLNKGGFRLVALALKEVSSLVFHIMFRH